MHPLQGRGGGHFYYCSISESKFYDSEIRTSENAHPAAVKGEAVSMKVDVYGFFENKL